MTIRAARRVVLAGVLLAAIGACRGPHAPTPEAVARGCGADPSRTCASQCGATTERRRETREGRCEDAVAELCRAGCEQRCGDHSAALVERIERADAYLDGHCGSGRAVEVPTARSAPTPHPLDDLLR
ncbi:MAG TPA: hypothetical protein VMR29_03685 [Candidatus Binatia bacterium]|nr:hypothetical protein [Candidatus Binatia bacterium]